MRIQPAFLAFAATATAASLSIVAGWQRGGLLAERVLLTCIGVVLVVAAHMLPALCRPHGWRIRALGAALWFGCMTATCYGHAVFFVMAQQHAGEVRAAVIPVIAASGRNLAEISSERAGVIARLARVGARKCGERCAPVRIERTILSARLDALDAESAEATRREKAVDRAESERAAVKSDPIAKLLVGFGVAAGRADLVIGIGIAAVLEGVACFCWLLALRPYRSTTSGVFSAQEVSHGLLVTRVTPASMKVARGKHDAAEPMTTRDAIAGERANELTLVMTAIRDGTVRSTVADIRKHLGCSQAKAAALRKQLAQHMQSSDTTQTKTI